MWRKILNPFMIWLLNSPLHGLVSQHIMLITVTGRKSGKVYTTPVEYGIDAGSNSSTVYIISSQKYAWWKNLRDGGAASLVIRGKYLTGSAQIASDQQTVLNTFAKIYPTRSGYEQFAASSVAIQINIAANVIKA